MEGEIPAKMYAETRPSYPEEVSPDTESEPESDLHLDTEDCVKPDPIDKNQKMRDTGKEVAEKDCEKSDIKDTETIEFNPYSALLLAKRGSSLFKKDQTKCMYQRLHSSFRTQF